MEESNAIYFDRGTIFLKLSTLRRDAIDGKRFLIKIAELDRNLFQRQTASLDPDEVYNQKEENILECIDYIELPPEIAYGVRHRERSQNSASNWSVKRPISPSTITKNT